MINITLNVLAEYMELFEEICFINLFFGIGITKDKKRWGICFIILCAVIGIARCFHGQDNLSIIMSLEVLDLLFYCSIVRCSVLRKLTYYIFAYTICGGINILTFWGITKISGAALHYMIDNNVYCIMIGMLLSIIFLLAANFAGAGRKKLRELGLSRLWYVSLCVVLFIILTGQYLYTRVEPIGYGREYFVQGAVLLSGIILLINTIGTIVLAEKRKADKYYIEFQQKLCSTYVKDYKESMEKQKNIKRIKHDMKAHMLQITDLYNKKDFQKLGEYLKDFSEEFKKSGCLDKDVGNQTVNVVMNYFADMSQRKNISFSCKGKIVRDLNMAESDVCSLFFNVISNAYEECLRKNENETCFIEIELKSIGNALLFISRNSCRLQKVIQESQIKRTSKRDKENHGYGKQIIESIVKKYNGSVQYKRFHNSWETEVILTDIYEHNIDGRDMI